MQFPYFSDYLNFGSQIYIDQLLKNKYFDKSQPLQGDQFAIQVDINRLPPLDPNQPSTGSKVVEEIATILGNFRVDFLGAPLANSIEALK